MNILDHKTYTVGIVSNYVFYFNYKYANLNSLLDLSDKG